MKMMGNPSPVNAARTIESVLAEQGTLPASQAIELIRQLAEQVARLHVAGRIHGAITPNAATVDENLHPVLSIPEAGSAVHLGAGEWEDLLPDLNRLLPLELPAEIDAARRQLEAGGIALDPRQFDLCRLGDLFCRLLTGNSAGAYLRSPRVKGQVPAELRNFLERALGCDGQKRFTDAADFLTELKAAASGRSGAGVETSEVAVSVLAADAVPAPGAPSRPTSDTTPSFVMSADRPSDTSVAPGHLPPTQTSVRAANDSNSPLPFSRLGHYEIVARIGRGGMGDVYRGYERTLDRHVAIKVLPADMARQEDFIRRFRAEATAAAKLIHPNIIQIHYIGEDAGHHFFTMQYVEGESLADLLNRKKKLSVDETLAIVEQALAGLAAAHEGGMVHRDIKPGNILLDTRSRRALLADFGLVKSLESSVTGHTATGVIMGTVEYISPEQGRGQAVDARSDLYSIGVLLYRMLSGRLPFEADNPTALIFQHVYEPPPPLAKTAPHVPPVLASIIETLLAKSPAERHQSANDVLADLKAFRSGQALPTRDSPAKGQTTIVRVPAFDDAGPLLPAGLTDLSYPNWWEQTRDRALSMFRRNAPEVLQQFQNTQQQVDGAVAEYERRCRAIHQLAHDAEQVLAELQKVAAAQRAAAAAADARARAANTPADEAQARTEQAACERTAADTDRQVAEQQEQLETIHLRLAQATARVQELRNQRDILRARMKAASLGDGTPGGAVTGPSRRLKPKWVAAAAATGALALGAVFVVWMLRSPPQGDVSAKNTSIPVVAKDETPPANPAVVENPANRAPQASGSGKGSPPPKRDLSVTYGSPPALVPFDADEAKKYQADWADYLKVPVEYENSLGMKFVLIPPGEFLMGSTPNKIDEVVKSGGEGPSKADLLSEGPQHRVIRTRPIYLGVNEVTQEEYEKVMGTNPSHFAIMGVGREAVLGKNTATYPVEMISWSDAAEYCAKLCQMERFKPFYLRSDDTVLPRNGTGYRLPTEAEWEFASRAGVTKTYFNGDKPEDLAKAGWFATNAAGGTHPVAELSANSFGLYDTLGNVGEWVHDEWDPAYFEEFAESPARDPRGPYAAGSVRVIRGGGWTNGASACRNSSRTSLAKRERAPSLGFRVALEVGAVQKDNRVKPFTTLDDPAYQKWIEEVAGVPAEEQVDVVVRKLKQRNEGFDGAEKHNVEDDIVTEFQFASDSVADISPLRGLARLKILHCSNGIPWDKRRLFDLSPLQGMPLTGFECFHTKIDDLTPLKGMKLTYLRIASTEVTSLSPIAGMPLTQLECSSTKVSDLSPVEGMPLTSLSIGSTKVSDLSPLHDMKLTNFSCNLTPVTDLSPLTGMPLTTLDCNRAKVSDLSPLAGMPLKFLNLQGAKSVSTLAPLQGMPLERLWCDQTSVTDLSPLKDLPLTELICDFNPETHTETLRSIKTLGSINGKPAAKFWSAIEGEKSGTKP